MRNLYQWSGKGWYTSQADGVGYTDTVKMNPQDVDNAERDGISVSNLARIQGRGTPRYYKSESQLREQLGYNTCICGESLDQDRETHREQGGWGHLNEAGGYCCTHYGNTCGYNH